MSDIKISEKARKAANATALHIVGELQMIPASEAYDFLVQELLSFRQHAINEACQPLVEACEKQSEILRAIRHAWDKAVPLPSLKKVSAAIEQGEHAVYHHRKEHGP